MLKLKKVKPDKYRRILKSLKKNF